VDIRRNLHLECLVRAHAIELLDEGVEALLLLQEILPAWASRFEFERPVHSLMTTIFLRTAGPDSLELDAEQQPIDGELGEIRQSPRRERSAIVRPHRVGQPIEPKNLLEDLA